MKMFVCFIKLAFKNRAGQKTRMLFQEKNFKVFTFIFILMQKETKA